MEAKTITRIERLASSRNGNPRFELGFDDGTSATTSSDISDAYTIGNPDVREGCKVNIEFSRAGRITRIYS